MRKIPEFDQRCLCSIGQVVWWKYRISNAGLRQMVLGRMNSPAIDEPLIVSLKEPCTEWKRQSGGRCMTWQPNTKTLTSKLGRVGNCRPPGWGPRNSKHQWLVTLAETAQSCSQGGEMAQWLKRKFTDRLGQPGGIPALVLPWGGMVARHRKDVTAERDQLRKTLICLFKVTTTSGQPINFLATERECGKLLKSENYLCPVISSLVKLQIHTILVKETTHKVAENSATAHDRFRPSWGSSGKRSPRVSVNIMFYIILWDRRVKLSFAPCLFKNRISVSFLNPFPYTCLDIYRLSRNCKGMLQSSFTNSTAHDRFRPSWGSSGGRNALVSVNLMFHLKPNYTKLEKYTHLQTNVVLRENQLEGNPAESLVYDAFKQPNLLHQAVSSFNWYDKSDIGTPSRDRLKHEAAWCSTFRCLRASQTRDSAGFQLGDSTGQAASNSSKRRISL
ncbi:hypothetical protein T265_02235 [Opisthorchis viverrini]|uniref:Uncharacterized protein n=1 Tax=Opisthorchis viverrini TaxID=6198 RepID=A0A075AIG6_OPIVI|nr:hypothetical protein T265_02235 [Opisthorchis viverrini]KER31599.1 hypothetical protein T265_02235 [Opisthorchis viverrini]